MTRHLYIHIPFCKSICTYCDFVRIKSSNHTLHQQYLDLILNQIKEESTFNQYETIYIGGGTPNALSNINLNYLLQTLNLYLDKKGLYEFCIELNPELVTLKQIEILKKNNVNRVSLGVQTTNDQINLLLHRYSSMKDVNQTIDWLRLNNINNISCDFIYNLPLLKLKDLDNAFSFLCNKNIKHVSFYSLELKEGAILTKQNYKLNNDNEQIQYEYINKNLQKLGYERYEVASFCKEELYSKHNLAYWLNKDWKAIGCGAYGFENNIYYSYDKSILKLNKTTIKYNNKELYQHLLIMGLRTKFGLNLNSERNYLAYKFFYEQIKDDVYIKNNHLIIKDINYLDDCLLKII